MKKIKVIIAEDTKATRRFYDRVFKDAYYDKRFAFDGSDALEKYKEWNPDIIILDIMMPVMSGFAVLKEIRGERGFFDRDTTIVMATSNGTKHDVTNCAKFDIQGYIVKPFDVMAIERQVLTAFEKKEPEWVQELKELRTEEPHLFMKM